MTLLVYPNNDYLGRLNYGYENVLVTKPHSLYLQIWVQSGALSLTAYLVFCIWLVFRRVRRIREEGITTPAQGLACAILVSVMAYLVMGITNDSCIATAPVFWLLAGYGIRQGSSGTSAPQFR